MSHSYGNPKRYKRHETKEQNGKLLLFRNLERKINMPKHIASGVDGIAEDLIRSIVQLSCSELHAKTLYEKYTAQLENGIVEDEKIEDHVLMMNDALDELTEYAQLRRRAMVTLYDMYKGNKDYWCQIKHLGASAYTLLECYLASDGDLNLLSLAMDANKAFIKALAHFLGAEVTDCAACLSDFLKGDTNGILRQNEDAKRNNL